MKELEALACKSTIKNAQSPFRAAQAALFCPGVQIRLSVSILLVIFSAIFPLIVLYEAPNLVILFEAFLTAPLCYGLFVMARRAADSESVSIYHLFSAFSRRYFYAFSTVFFFALFFLLPLLLPIGVFYGSTLLASYVGETFALGFAPPIILLGALTAVALLFPALLLQSFSYLIVSIRVKEGRYPIFRALGRSFSLIRRSIGTYLKLRMQLLLLSLLSIISVFALFPIYTLPLFLTANANLLDLLTEEKEKREVAQYNQENNNITENTEVES